MAGWVGGDVAEPAAEGHDGVAEVGPAASDVRGDPFGDGGAGDLVEGVGHGVHDDRFRPGGS